MRRKLRPGTSCSALGLVRSWTPPSGKHSSAVARWTSRRSVGSPACRRTEIYFHQFDGKFYLTGRPGFKRDWVANIVANPEFTLHLSTASPPTSRFAVSLSPIPEERARILYRALTESWGSDPNSRERHSTGGRDRSFIRRAGRSDLSRRPSGPLCTSRMPRPIRMKSRPTSDGHGSRSRGDYRREQRPGGMMRSPPPHGAGPHDPSPRSRDPRWPPRECCSMTFASQ